MPELMPPPVAVDPAVSTLEIIREQRINAAPARTWESLLAILGPRNETMPGHPMPMVLEAWPGGRWFRDLGGSAGHFWGHVQVIKPPMLIEICGPMFMSYPGVNHIQYRLAADGAGTLLRLVHRAVGVIPAEHKTGVVSGWEHQMEALKRAVEQ